MIKFFLEETTVSSDKTFLYVPYGTIGYILKDGFVMECRCVGINDAEKITAHKMEFVFEVCDGSTIIAKPSYWLNTIEGVFASEQDAQYHGKLLPITKKCCISDVFGGYEYGICEGSYFIEYTKIGYIVEENHDISKVCVDFKLKLTKDGGIIAVCKKYENVFDTREQAFATIKPFKVKRFPKEPEYKTFYGVKWRVEDYGHKGGTPFPEESTSLCDYPYKDDWLVCVTEMGELWMNNNCGVMYICGKDGKTYLACI